MSTVAANAPRHARLDWALAALAVGALLVTGGMIVSIWCDPLEGEPPALGELPPGYGTALYVQTQPDAEIGPAWMQLAAAIELVRSSRANLTQAESLRATAVTLVQISKENVEARRAESGPAALVSARYQQLIAESQLALADELLGKARALSESSVALLEVARQNAFRPQESDESQDPADATRSDPPDLVRAKAAARRSRHA